MKNKKREPLLIDRFLVKTYDTSNERGIIPREFWDSTRHNLMLSKRFVLDHEAARYCAELLAQNPRIIADAQDFAIPPFERTYIEFPYREWYQIISGKEPDTTADERVGYLIVGNTVRGLAYHTNLLTHEDECGLTPIEYQLNAPWTNEEELAVAQKLQISRMGFDVFYWGESILKFGDHRVRADGTTQLKLDDWQKEGVRSLRANHQFKLMHHSHVNPAELFDKLYHGSAGDLRNIIGILLFLNRTSKTRYETEINMQPGRWIGRKQANLVKHRVISYSVNPVPRLIKLAANESVRRRLHDVRGHLCHNEIARTNSHEHEWVETLDEPGGKAGRNSQLQWHCICGGLRWWRKPHMRGHESKGLVTSEYKITE